MTSNILLITLPETEVERLKAMRDFIMASLEGGVMVLPADAAWEIIEAPPLGRVEVRPEAEPDPGPSPEPPAGAEEKRAVIQRLKDYRAANGLGSLEAVSVKTAHQKGRRLPVETLRYLCAGGAPKMPMEDWRKIGRALDRLEEKERNALQNEQKGS